MSELQEQKKKTVELILSRPLELLAIDTNDFKKEQLESLLKALNKNLYLLANQIVNTLFQEFWGLDAEGLWQNEKVRSVFRAYIKGYAEAKEAEKAIQELYKEKVEKPDGKTDEQFDEELKRLKELKKSTLEGIKRDLMKYIESDAFKDDKALMLTAANFKTNVAKYIGEESQPEITHTTTQGKKIIDRVLDNIVRRTAFEALQNFLHEIEDVLTAKGTRQLRQYDRSIPIYFDYDYNFEPFQYTDKIIKREIGQPNKIEEVTETVCRFVWMPVWTKANTVDMMGGIQFEINFGADKSKNEDFVKEVMEMYKNRNKEDGPAAHQAVGDSHIKIDWRRNKKFLQQTFKRKADPKHDPGYFKKGLCMGVDLGYKIPLYWGLSDLSDAKPLGDKEQIKKICTQYENRIRDLQRKVKSADLSGNTAHGKLGELQKLRQKERLSVKQLNRKYAKKLVGIAVEKKAGTIVIEDIDFTKKREELEKRRLALNEKITANPSKQHRQKTYPSIYDRLFTMFRNWSYGQLIRFIKEEAEENGIEVVSIDPTYTSRICSVCGVMGNRANQLHLTVTKDFQCSLGHCPAKYNFGDAKKVKAVITPNKDGRFEHKILADRNAAFNIAQGGALMVIQKNKKPGIDEQTEEMDKIEAKLKGKRKEQKQTPKRGQPPAKK
jgi:transposase